MGSRHRNISRTVVLLASLLVQKKTFLLFSLFALLVRPLAKKISCEGNLSLRLLCKERGRCPKRSGFLILGGDGFRLTEILFSLMRHRHHLIVSSFIRDLVLDQLELEEDGELEEARILKALELSYKEVYDLEEML